MHTPSAAELLEAWERAYVQPPTERALTLLAFALPDRPPDELAQLSIGGRDDYLLTLRERLFGTRLVSLTACPACSDRVELDFATVDVRSAPANAAATALCVSAEGYEVRFRLPNSRDLVALAEAGDVETSPRTLLNQCIESARRGGKGVPAERLPEPVALAVIEAMAAADPQADVQLALTCPACGERWSELFDIVSFLWAEVDGWAKRTLRDVHTLALHYGWREADILALSARRRQAYLGMLGA